MKTMIKALRLAWISRLLQERQANLKTVLVHFFSKLGGLNFLLTCSYDVEYCEKLPRFYRDILSFFSILKSLYEDETCKKDLILYNNKEILIGGKPFFNKEWFSKGIKSIRNLLNPDGTFLTFEEFKARYSLGKSSSLHFYQAVSAIPNYLLNKARAPENLHSENIDDDLTCFQLDESVVINLMKAKASDFYRLLINRLYKKDRTGPSRWNKAIPMEKTEWSKIFKTTYRTCKEPKLKELGFKFTHLTLLQKKNFSGLR